MGKERLLYLLQQYTSNKATREEVTELFSALQTAEGEEALKDMIVREGLQVHQLLAGSGQLPSDQRWDAMQDELMLFVRDDKMTPVVSMEEQSGEGNDLIPNRRTDEPTLNGRKATVLSLSRVTRAAVFILICAGIGTTAWMLFGRRKKGMPVAVQSHAADIAPGGNKAVLILADGSTISLDSAHAGTLAQQGSVKVVKLNTGALSYKGKGADAGEVLYNTIATPYGGQYQIVLPDGSKVWLNAASSLRYPTAFDGKERVVELKGEGYFEIAHHAAQPFKVHVPGAGGPGKGVDVQVLGTDFNIMAYSNEGHINTTLVNGKVRVETQEGTGSALEPGHQAVVDDSTRSMHVVDANVDQVIAWKNGLFRFRETGIRELMRQVERWYNVQVVYETTGNDQDFTGIVSRNEPVSVLLHTLELTGTVHFRVDGKKIIVLP